MIREWSGVAITADLSVPEVVVHGPLPASWLDPDSQFRAILRIALGDTWCVRPTGRASVVLFTRPDWVERP
jgi:hypothetical protein